MSAVLPSQLRVHAALREIPREAWNALVPPDGAPFLEWDWLHALEESGSVTSERGWRPAHLALWQGARLVAAAPAYVKSDSHGEFVFDWSWASAAERLGFHYYPKLVLAVPLTPATGPRFLVAQGEDREARIRQLAQGALEFARSEGLSSVHALFPQQSEAALLESLGYGVRLGVQYHWLNGGYASWEDFLQRFRSKRRNQLRRERRAPAEQGIELRTLRGDELAGVDPEAVYAIYTSTIDKYLFGQRYLNLEFFRQVLRQCRSRIEWVEARKDGRLVAGAFNLTSGNVLYGRYWGCLEEHPFLHFNVCLYHSIEEAIARGVTRFEPGAGGEHKLVRGFEPRLTWSAHWIFHPRLDAAVRSFLAQEAGALREGLPRWQEETGFRRADVTGRGD